MYITSKIHRDYEWRTRNKKARVFVTNKTRETGSFIEERWPAEDIEKEDRKVAKAALKALYPEATFIWSKHAGCSMCPCSPGFIVKDPADYSSLVAAGQSVFITVWPSEEACKDAEKEQERVATLQENRKELLKDLEAQVAKDLALYRKSILEGRRDGQTVSAEIVAHFS